MAASEKETAKRSRLGSVFAHYALCCGIALSGKALANEEYACPGGNFGRTGVHSGAGPEKKPDGWKVLVSPVDSSAGNFLVFGGKILTVNRSSLISTNFQGERMWEADIALPGRQFPFESDDMHQILGWQDKVIVLSHKGALSGAVKAFAIDDGRLLWSVPGGELKKDGRNSGSLSNEDRIPLPVIYKNCLHFAGERTIRRLSLEDGKELKPFEFLEEEKGRVAFTSPLVTSDSKLFFCAMIDKPETAHCFAIDLESGELAWKQKRGAYKDRILADGRSIIVMGKQVAASDPNDRGQQSKPITSYDLTTGLELPMEDLRSTYEVGAVLHQGTLFASRGRELAKVDISTNRNVWKYRSKESLEPVLVMGGGVVYAEESLSRGRLHAINESDGSSLWICEAEPGQWRREFLTTSNGALFCLTNRGVEVLGNPVETQTAPKKDGRMPSDPAAMRKEIEDIDRQINGLRKEWDECKQLLGETPAADEATDGSKEKREASSRRVREIAAAVPKLKARRAELEKLLK